MERLRELTEKRPSGAWRLRATTQCPQSVILTDHWMTAGSGALQTHDKKEMRVPNQSASFSENRTTWERPLRWNIFQSGSHGNYRKVSAVGMNSTAKTLNALQVLSHTHWTMRCWEIASFRRQWSMRKWSGNKKKRRKKKLAGWPNKANASNISLE